MMNYTERLCEKVIPQRRRRLAYSHLLRNLFCEGRWRSYVQVDSGSPVLLKIGRHKWHKDFCADPFLFFHNGEVFVFYETMTKAGKGILGCFKKVKGRWIQQGIVLEQPCHLSYPQVFEDQGEIYMIPESFDHGKGEVVLWKAEEFPLRWKKAATLFKGGYADSTLLKQENHYYLITNLVIPNRTMEVWVASSLTGPWFPHPENKSLPQSNRLSRCAGRFVVDQGRLYRMAQDCNGTYGKRVFKVPIDEISPDVYREGRAEVLLSGTLSGRRVRQHTYNELVVEGKKYIVFDALDYRMAPLHEIARRLIKLVTGIARKYTNK